MTKERQFHTFLKGIILIGFTLFFVKLLSTNQILYFIAPRMKPFMYFTAIVLIILGIFQVWRGTSTEKNTHSLGCACCHSHEPPSSGAKSILYYAIFIIPLVTGFLFTNHSLGSSIVEKRNIQFTIGNSNNTIESESSVTDSTEGSEGNLEGLDNTFVDNIMIGDPMTEEEYERIKESLNTEKTIVTNDKNYLPLLQMLEENLDAFVGKEIETLGFIYREQGFSNEQAVVARFGVSCCVADASVYGFMVNGKVAAFEEDTWVAVKGRIGKSEFQGDTIPVLEVKSIKKIPIPDNPYIYDLGIQITSE